jgi:hypothetical protein
VGAIVLLNGIANAAALSMELAAIARDAVREAAPPIEPAAPMPPAFRDLLGIYVDEEQAMIARVEWRDGALQIVDPDDEAWRPRLVPTETADVFVIAPGVRESGERVTFSRRPDGRVVSLFLAVATMVRFGPVGPD